LRMARMVMSLLFYFENSSGFHVNSGKAKGVAGN
jgi:hypothetical protein